MAFESKIKKALGKFGTELVTDLEASLQRNEHGGGTSGGGTQSGLAGSIKFKIFGRDTAVVFALSMNDYGIYLDKGTKGAKKKGTGGEKMVDSIESWIVGKSQLRLAVQKIKAEKNLSYKDAQRSLAWAIKRSINKRGIRWRKQSRLGGSRWFTSVIQDGRVNTLSQQLSKELSREIKIELVELL